MSTYRARVGATLVAEAAADQIVMVDGNPYFPPTSLQPAVTTESMHSTVCGWKGTAKYLNIMTPDGKEIENAVWYYPDALPAASHIKGYFAFYASKVTVKKED